MLFHLRAEDNLDAIRAMLDSWGEQTDGFRRAAVATRNGEAPTSLTIHAIEDARSGLLQTIADLDRALSALPLGDPRFRPALQTQIKAVALLDSVVNSYDELDGFVAIEVSPAISTTQTHPIAAE